LGREGIQGFLQTYRKTVDELTCVAIYGTNMEVMDKERHFRGGTKVTLCTHLMQKPGVNFIEQTNMLENIRI